MNARATPFTCGQRPTPRCLPPGSARVVAVPRPTHVRPVRTRFPQLYESACLAADLGKLSGSLRWTHNDARSWPAIGIVNTDIVGTPPTGLTHMFALSLSVMETMALSEAPQSGQIHSSTTCTHPYPRSSASDHQFGILLGARSRPMDSASRSVSRSWALPTIWIVVLICRLPLLAILDQVDQLDLHGDHKAHYYPQGHLHAHRYVQKANLRQLEKNIDDRLFLKTRHGSPADLGGRSAAAAWPSLG